ncbi:hypothetical protein BHU72_14200 [Desulfuribacillus stibiiarsenatis]|uniref:Stage II sporulation protein M n=1 Tax=Desulfuribacillus stibiiarsenatis TaxID=1390249 RepID=A0A1E5L8Q2_9FIRM|nr:stage II sporulation protein M [Desulfuribacillus stibiiarsenatis]OEH86369.1 hypothetical protein BHU72_14200 [Desulfuribacillus stibiiarsenatis]
MYRILSLIKENRNYIYLAGIIFIVGNGLGVVFVDQFYGLIEEALGTIKDLGEKIAENGHPFYATWVIFLNNIRSAFMFILLGSIVAIPTIFGLFINGVLIGVVLSMIGEAGVSPIMLLIFGVMPHGIFEIPAILIAGGFGIKLGTVWIKPLPGLTRWQSYTAVFRESMYVFVFITVLLVVAGLVEGLITPVLLNYFVGEIGLFQ